MTLVERINHLLRKRSRSDQRALASEAEQWLKDDTLNAGLALMRRQAIEQWARSPNEEVQRECWRALRVIDSFARAMKKFVEDDALATAKEDRRDRRDMSS